jgi:hypothetical protein
VDIPILLCPSVPSNRVGPTGGADAGLRVYANDYPVSDTIGGTASTSSGLLTTGLTSRQYNGFWIRTPSTASVNDPKKAPTATDIEDGTSFTFMVFEDAARPHGWDGTGEKVATGYPATNGWWADPANKITVEVICGNRRTINCNNGNEIFSFHFGGAMFLFGDGSVHFLRQDISGKTFVALYSRNGGDVPGTDWD